MRKIFRLRTLLILAVIGGIVAVVMSRRSVQSPAAYPDPWLAPTTPGMSSSDATDPVSKNGVAAPSTQSESADS
jgi:hypothetical protein